MASRIYVTEGLVLSRTGVGETSLLASLFAKEYGRMQVRAQGARNVGSKLRFGLEPLSCGRFSLVKGRNGWLAVGVEPLERLRTNSEGVRVLGNIIGLLERLLPPHEPLPALYGLLREDLAFITEADDRETLRSAECITVLHTLSALGYLPEAAELSPFVLHGVTQPLAEAMKGVRPRAVALINTSLTASGL